MYDKNTIMCVFQHENVTLNTTLQNSEYFDDPIIGISYALLTTFVLTSNLMLIYGFYKTSRPFTIITKLFIYLSLMDIVLVSLTGFYTSLSIFDMDISCSSVYIIASLTRFVFYLGLAIFATISFLRYWSIKKPLHSIEANRIVFVLIVQAILCGAFAGDILIVFFLNLNPVLIMKTNYALPISQFLAVSFVLSINIMSYRILKSMKMMSGFSADNIENTSTQRQKTMSEANICLLYITVFYIICPIPVFVVYLFRADTVISYSGGSYLYTYTHIFYLSNGGINSLIVIIRTKYLREFYKKKFYFSKISRSPKD